MNHIKHESPYGNYFLSAEFRKYPNGQTSIQLNDEEDGLPYCRATISVQNKLEDGEVAIKNYSENEGILESLISAGIVFPPHRVIDQGYVKIPVCKLKITKEV